MKTLNQMYVGLSKEAQIKKFKDNITILEFVKDYQQNIIAELEYITGLDLARKSLPKFLVDEIDKKKLYFLEKDS